MPGGEFHELPAEAGGQKFPAGACGLLSDAVKSGRAGTGYETALSLLKYIEVEFEMVKNLLLL